jgi:hypothetical protein
MKKLLALSVLLAMFVYSQTSFGMGRILVFKGSIKAAKSIFDVNDTNTLVSGTVQCYWVVEVAPYVIVIPSSYDRGQVMDSSAVIYSTKDKYFKIIPDCIGINPYDPCKVVVYSFDASDDDGEVWFDVVGKGKLTKFISNDTPKDYVQTSLKGTGFIDGYDFFDPNDTYSGPVTISLTLDSKWTRNANDLQRNSDTTINDITGQLISKGGWTQWPNLTPP